MSHPIVTMALNAVFPPRCPSCRGFVTTQGTLCADCWKKLHFITEPLCTTCGYPFEYKLAGDAQCGPCLAEAPPFTKARSALRYDEHSSREVVGFKFHDRTQLAPMFAEWLMRAGEGFLAEADLIVPVPLHRWRLLRRRYNQAALLAYALGRKIKRPVATSLLLRTRHTVPQAGLTRAQRLTNLQGAFAVHPKRKDLVSGKKLVLIDDVMTTGATLGACAKALRKAGAAEIYVLTVARTVLGS